MKYVNHLCTSRNGGKMEEHTGRTGLEGYGAYWTIVEVIGGQIIPESPKTFLTLSWRKWARHLDVTTKKTQFLVRSASLAKLIRLYEEGEKITIDIPNILKYADEYTKKVLTKSGQTPEHYPTNSGLPALPAFPDLPEEKKEKKDLKDLPVDNSTTGANGSPPASPDGAGAPLASIVGRIGKAESEPPSQLTPEEKSRAVADVFAKFTAGEIDLAGVSIELRARGLEQADVNQAAPSFLAAMPPKEAPHGDHV